MSSVVFIQMVRGGLLVLLGTGHYMLTFSRIFFVRAMLIGAIDLHYFTTLSVTLTLAGGQQKA